MEKFLNIVCITLISKTVRVIVFDYTLPVRKNTGNKSNLYVIQYAKNSQRNLINKTLQFQNYLRHKLQIASVK